MKIMFIGTSGVHHPLLAAYSYLDKSVKNLDDMAAFGDARLDAAGLPVFVGEDFHGNQVYTLGLGKEVLLGKKSIDDLIAILGFSSHDLAVKPVSVKIEKWLPGLNKISLLLGNNYMARRLSYRFLMKQQREISKDVENFKQELIYNHLLH